MGCGCWWASGDRSTADNALKSCCFCFYTRNGQRLTDDPSPSHFQNMDHKQVTVRFFFSSEWKTHRKNCNSWDDNFSLIMLMQFLMLQNILLSRSEGQPQSKLPWRYQWLTVPQSVLVYTQFFSFSNVFWTFSAKRKTSNLFLCLVLKYKILVLFSAFLTKPTLVYVFPYWGITEFILFRGNSEIEIVCWRWSTRVTCCSL